MSSFTRQDCTYFQLLNVSTRSHKFCRFDNLWSLLHWFAQFSLNKPDTETNDTSVTYICAQKILLWHWQQMTLMTSWYDRIQNPYPEPCDVGVAKFLQKDTRGSRSHFASEMLLLSFFTGFLFSFTNKHIVQLNNI